MIKARVIRILDEDRLVLNVGTVHGVERGMKFGIFTPEDPIVDPKTKAQLGTLSIRKATVEATAVRELFSVCMSADRVSSLTVAFASTASQRSSLPVDKRQIQELPTGYSVGVGDEAIQDEVV